MDARSLRCVRISVSWLLFGIRFVEDEETILVHVVMCLMLWSVIDLYHRNAGEDRKQQLRNWMVGKVTDTVYMETKGANEGSTNEANVGSKRRKTCE